MATDIRYSKLLVVILGLPLVIFAVNSSPINKLNSTDNKIGVQNQLPDEDSSFFGLYNMFGGGNPSSTPTGNKLIEGDIVLAGKDDLTLRKAVPDSSLYWPNGEVVYTYHESITPTEMNIIEAAMRHWRQHTCVTFRPRQAHDIAFVRFRSDTQGCWSLVGRQISSPNGYGQGQDVSIGPGCANLNVVVHEIGHVLGFYHEQSRSDRDQYIDIVWNNVLPGYALQFRKESDASYNIPYDLTSTMQYPQWAFSKEIFEKSTIVARNPAYQRFLSKNYPLSFRDRLLANQMYSCTAACGASGSCGNGGYMRATSSIDGGYDSGPQCSCDCPPNFTGPNCETPLRSDYYEDLPCGGTITQEGRIETPGYPHRTAPGQSCMWDIQAPAGKRVSIKFYGFEFAPRFTKPGTKVINKCFNETVEIRLKNGNIYDGDTYCGNDITPGTVLKSDGPRAVIIITANDKMIGRGLSAKVKFVRDGFGGNDNDGDNENEIIQEDNNKPRPQEPATSTTEAPIFTTPGVSTVAPPVVQTLPPIMPPQPPPIVVTTSSLLEEYEKESKKTLPPVIPFYNQ